MNSLAEIYAQLAFLILDGKFLKIRELLENLPFELEGNAVQDILGLHRGRKILLIFAGKRLGMILDTSKFPKI